MIDSTIVEMYRDDRTMLAWRQLQTNSDRLWIHLNITLRILHSSVQPLFHYNCMAFIYNFVLQMAEKIQQQKKIVS